jgi:hypothetical protein
MPMKVTGRCHCGRISFAAEVEAERVRVCHCSGCQTLSGSAFRTNVPVISGTFALHSGEPKTYVKTGDSGNKVTHAFCGDCGSPIYSLTTAEPRGYSLRVGTLDQRAELMPARQIWCRSALPWSMDLTGTAQTERQ